MTTTPLVTVVIPVKNEERSLSECLQRIQRQTYPAEALEILVVDGRSEDRTREIVRQYQPSFVSLQCLDNPKKERGAAMNVGIQAAKGDIIVRVDARSVIAPTYVADCVKTLLDSGADNVGGVQRPLAVTPTQHAIALALTHPFGIGNAQFRLGRKSGDVDTVYLGCFRKSVFDRVGFFDERVPILSEDADMNYRIRQAGGRVYLNHEIVTSYDPRDSLWAMWKLYRHYGRARAGNFMKHRVLAWRQGVAPAFVVWLGGLGIVAGFSSAAASLLGATLAMYLGVDALVAGALAFRNGGIRLFWTLLAIFPCLHLSWGSGFLEGVIIRVWMVGASRLK